MNEEEISHSFYLPFYLLINMSNEQQIFEEKMILLPAEVLNGIFCFLSRIFLGESVSLVCKFYELAVEDFFNERARRANIVYLRIHSELGWHSKPGHFLIQKQIHGHPLPMPTVPPPLFVRQLDLIDIDPPFCLEMVTFLRLLCQAESPEFLAKTRINFPRIDYEISHHYEDAISLEMLTDECQEFFTKCRLLSMDSNNVNSQFRYNLANSPLFNAVGHLEAVMNSVLQIRPYLKWLEKPLPENSRWKCRRLDFLIYSRSYVKKWEKCMAKLFKVVKEEFIDNNDAHQVEWEIWLFGMEKRIPEFRLENRERKEILELKEMEETICEKIEDEDENEWTNSSNYNKQLEKMRQKAPIFRLCRRFNDFDEI